MKIKRFALLACLAAALLLAAPCAWAQGENLLQNGDFSESSGALPDGWTTSAWVMDELYSSFSLSADEEQGQVAVIESEVANDARFEQTIAVEPETVYEISGLIRAEYLCLHRYDQRFRRRLDPGIAVCAYRRGAKQPYAVCPAGRVRRDRYRAG